MSDFRVTTGPVVNLSMNWDMAQVRGYEAYDAEVSFHPARVAGCEKGKLTFVVKHPKTRERVGTIEFTTGSNKEISVKAQIFDVEIRRTLSHPSPKKVQGARFNTVSCGSKTFGPEHSLSPSVRHLWFRAGFDDIDIDEPWSFLRRRPALLRFYLRFPADCGEEWKNGRKKLIAA